MISLLVPVLLAGGLRPGAPAAPVPNSDAIDSDCLARLRAAVPNEQTVALNVDAALLGCSEHSCRVDKGARCLSLLRGALARESPWLRHVDISAPVEHLHARAVQGLKLISLHLLCGQSP